MTTYILSAAALLLVFPVFGNGATRVVHSKSETASADVVVHLFNVKTFQNRVLPAYQSYQQRNDVKPLIALLKECLAMIEANPKLANQADFTVAIIREDIGILQGTEYYSPDAGKTSNQGNSRTARRVRREFAQGQVAGMLLKLLCVPYDQGVNPEQDMSNSRLVNYLYDRSEWIKDVFTFSGSVTGRPYEYSMGESTEPFTEKGIEEFDRALATVERPQDANMGREFDNLRALVKKAATDPDLILVLTVT